MIFDWFLLGLLEWHDRCIVFKELQLLRFPWEYSPWHLFELFVESQMSGLEYFQVHQLLIIKLIFPLDNALAPFLVQLVLIFVPSPTWIYRLNHVLSLSNLVFNSISLSVCYGVNQRVKNRFPSFSLIF